MTGTLRKRRSFKRPAPDFGAPFKIGSRLVRWCEAPDCYMRPMGFADEVHRAEGGSIRDMGKGWFTDSEDQSEVARGVVYRLPHGRGFVAGVADPCNVGPAMLAVCEAPEDDAMTAARYADQLAEWYAESERDYRDADRAGQAAGECLAKARGAARDLLDRARHHRTSARDALRAALATREDASGMVPPGIADSHRAVYRLAVLDMRAAIDAAREALEDGRDAFREALSSVSREYRDAFRDGAEVSL